MSDLMDEQPSSLTLKRWRRRRPQSPESDHNLGSLPMLTAVERAGSLRRPLVFAIAAAMEVGIAVLDFVTGPHLSMRLFYLVPIVIVAWSISRFAGWMFAAASAVIDTCVHLVQQPHYVVIILVQGLLGGVVLVAVATFVTETRVLLHFERETARHDYLTGLLNRRAFNESADVEFARVQRGRAPWSLLLMDIDKFKEINDRMGHDAGDDVLCALAAAVTSTVRATDVVARLGGDEFVVLCPFATEHDAVNLAGRIRARFGDICSGSSISIGVVSSPPVPCEIDALMDAADGLMYEAKRLGKGIASITLEPL
jgi:diguanylate cyclase (GGDEF)-like protein